MAVTGTAKRRILIVARYELAGSALVADLNCAAGLQVVGVADAQPIAITQQLLPSVVWTRKCQ